MMSGLAVSWVNHLIKVIFMTEATNAVDFFQIVSFAGLNE